MGATRDDFVKYPRTLHLFGSKGTDDDKHLGRKESEAFIVDPSLIVEEKIDGTNVGIHFNTTRSIPCITASCRLTSSGNQTLRISWETIPQRARG